MRQLKIEVSKTTRTPMMEKFFADIKKYKPLTSEEEVETNLIRLNGETEAIRKAAEDKLVLHNLKFVVSVTKQYCSNPIWMSDYINNGILGLIIAAQRFDHTKGFRFISYAVWWIRQSIIGEMSGTKDTIRIPQHTFRLADKINKFTERFFVENEYEPSVEEVAEAMEITEFVAASGMNASKLTTNDSEMKNTALDEGGLEARSDRFMDEEADSDILDFSKQADARAVIKILTKDLRAADKQLIDCVYDLDNRYDGRYSLVRAAEILGVTESYIGIKLRDIIKSIRIMINSDSSRTWVKEIL